MDYSREQLIFLLTTAAEVEHALCCQYLFSALSLKRTSAEGIGEQDLATVNAWEQVILMVARSEMEHLGLVCNLLTAVGGAPHLNKPNFPQPGTLYPAPMALSRLNLDTLHRFIVFEAPESAPPPPLTHDPEELVGTPIPYRSIGQLYAAIREILAGSPLPDAELFTGPPNAQLGKASLQYLYPKSVQFQPGVFDQYLVPVVDRASALRAVDLIVEQGEGGAPHPDPSDQISHYERFVRIRTELAERLRDDPYFQPSRDVVDNPCLYAHPDALRATVITNPTARAVLALFNGAYQTMLLLLTRFFAHTDENQAEIEGLLYTFYPLMSMVVRPLGEILTQLPAGDPASPERAGPSFETDPTICLLPHKRSAWRYLKSRLENLASDAATVAQQPFPDPAQAARLRFIAENVGYMARKFGTLVHAMN